MLHNLNRQPSLEQDAFIVCLENLSLMTSIYWLLKVLLHYLRVQLRSLAKQSIYPYNEG